VAVTYRPRRLYPTSDVARTRHVENVERPDGSQPTPQRQPRMWPLTDTHAATFPHWRVPACTSRSVAAWLIAVMPPSRASSSVVPDRSGRARRRTRRTAVVCGRPIAIRAAAVEARRAAERRRGSGDVLSCVPAHSYRPSRREPRERSASWRHRDTRLALGSRGRTHKLARRWHIPGAGRRSQDRHRRTGLDSARRDRSDRL
jgi:hypothetical protein